MRAREVTPKSPRRWKIVRRLAQTTPRAGKWKCCCKALEDEALQALAALMNARMDMEAQAAEQNAAERPEPLIAWERRRGAKVNRLARLCRI